jgi:hypothetical protein
MEAAQQVSRDPLRNYEQWVDAVEPCIIPRVSGALNKRLDHIKTTGGEEVSQGKRIPGIEVHVHTPSPLAKITPAPRFARDNDDQFPARLEHPEEFQDNSVGLKRVFECMMRNKDIHRAVQDFRQTRMDFYSRRLRDPAGILIDFDSDAALASDIAQNSAGSAPKIEDSCAGGDSGCKETCRFSLHCWRFAHLGVGEVRLSRLPFIPLSSGKALT